MGEFGYSKDWDAIKSKKMKATYSEVLHKTHDPEWVNLPEVRFKTSLSELLHESLILHITHKGKYQNTTISRCNLLFRTLVNKKIRDEEKIVFNGKLKPNDATISGTLIFRTLPLLSQMKPAKPTLRALHTEKGIYDAITFLPGMPMPRQEIFMSDHVSVQRDGSNSDIKKKDSSDSIKKGSFSESVKKEGSSSDVVKKEGSSSDVKKELPKPDLDFKQQKPKLTNFVDDLITFSPTPGRKKSSIKRTNSHDDMKTSDQISQDFGNDNTFSQKKDFNPFTDWEPPKKQDSSMDTVTLVNPFQVKKEEKEDYNPFA